MKIKNLKFSDNAKIFVPYILIGTLSFVGCKNYLSNKDNVYTEEIISNIEEEQSYTEEISSKFETIKKNTLINLKSFLIAEAAMGAYFSVYLGASLKKDSRTEEKILLKD